MSNPCKDCLVTAMCLDACEKIEMYVDERVKELMPVRVDYCNSEFLNGIGRRLRNHPNKDTILSHDHMLYNVVIEDGLIKEIFRNKPDKIHA